ncbi:DNA damage-binding protein 2-like [Haliotis cracherodii]|uniref:DNA damage-binding protein 2-like n=1 Tax=Haliotis cracherodii TaxID=6455 RepID=UPI0039ECA63A
MGPRRSKRFQELNNLQEESGATCLRKRPKKTTSQNQKDKKDKTAQSVVDEARENEVKATELSTTCRRILNGQTEVKLDFSVRKKELSIAPNLMFPYLQRSLNFIHHQYQASIGLLSHPRLQHAQGVAGPVVSMVSNMQLFRTGSPFDRRVTAMAWHPSSPNILAAGSKGGDIYLWDINNINNNDNFIHGIGPGGSIQAIKFWPWNHRRIITASIDGRVVLQDTDGRKADVLSDTFNCHDFWYCSVDVSQARKVVVVGDNVGNTLLLSHEGKKIWSHKLHKGKVTHAEFSPREDWSLCTASIDHTVKLWDVRMIKDKKSALCVLQHDKGVNSVYFNPSDGCRLLTTDQGSEIRVYRAPEWSLERTIPHPHRFFQHITPIKASWHPLLDLIVVGRYPDKTFPGYTSGERRTIDVFDANTGATVCQLHDPSAPGIVSLNKFSPDGDKLASGMGVNILVWCRQGELETKQQVLLQKYKQGINSSSDSSQRQPKTRKPTNKQTKSKSLKDTAELKTKLKTKTKKL